MSPARGRAVGAKRRGWLDPARLQRGPFAGQFAQHREACAHILAALVIVRGRRQHRLRMAGGARCTRAWKAAASSRRSRRRSRHRCARAAGRSDRRPCPRRPWRRPARSIAGSARWRAHAGGCSANRRRTGRQPSGRWRGRSLRAPSAACCSTVRSRRERAGGAVGAIDREMRQQLGRARGASGRLRRSPRAANAPHRLRAGRRSCGRRSRAAPPVPRARIGRPAAQRGPGLGQQRPRLPRRAAARSRRS